MNKSGLLIRLAVVVSFSALAIGFISAQLFDRFTYLNEQRVSNQAIEQLVQTVASTASIAAYLNDEELAKEVVRGLASNDLIKDARIQTEALNVSTFVNEMPLRRTFSLYSPFEKDRQVGQLVISPDLEHIEELARNLGQVNGYVLIAQSILVTIVVVLISFVLITQPILKTARRLGNIKPGTNNRLEVPLFHHDSELGELVRDVNTLLQKTETQLVEERNLRQEIEVLEKRFRMLFENAASPIVLLEPLGSILLCNEAFKSMLEQAGISQKKNFGELLEGLFEPGQSFLQTLRNALSSNEIATGEFLLRSPHAQTGESIWMQVVVTSIRSDDLKEYYQVTLQDISTRRKELERLSLEADYDKLTQLLNRRAGEKSIVDLMLAQKPFALVLIDLDGFKPVNDIYGHNAGDEILIHISKKIANTIREQDLSCRWGGDEFVLVIENTSKDGILTLMEKLIKEIRAPYFLERFDKSLSVDASIGVAFYPSDEQNMQNLISLADHAMYTAKAGGAEVIGNYLCFSDDLNRNPKADSA